MKTRESISEELVAEAFAQDTSPASTLDTRSLLVRTGANVIAAIESLDTDAEAKKEEDDFVDEVIS